MGANDFETTALGRTPGEAFDAAHAEALYMDGHGGYTGTIAEKPGFTFFGTVPPRWKSEDYVRAIWARGAQLRDARDERAERDWAKRTGTTYPTPKRLPLTTWEKRERALLKRLATAGLNVDRAADLVEDKWGPAVCIEVVGAEAARMKERRGRKGTRDRVFVFFGLASS